MAEPFNPKKPLTSIEAEVLSFWQKERIFEKSLFKDEKRPTFCFFDGPPFATGLPHYGHILQSVIKDLIPRYHTMRGSTVPRVWGWDCHGVPVEHLIEKELELDGPGSIEAFGIAAFNEACEKSVLRFADHWKEFVPRMGRWVDMQSAYRTMDEHYIESVWWVFTKLWQAGLIYEGKKPMHLSPELATALSNFEVGLNYKDITDYTVTVAFPALDSKEEYFLAWTTTAWTLPANTALAVHPDIQYVCVEKEGKKYWLAEKRLQAYAAELGEDPVIVCHAKGAELVGRAYAPPFEMPGLSSTEHAKSFSIHPADFIEDTAGTGIAHEAPAFGEEDFYLAKDRGFGFICHVDMHGRFTKDFAPLAGMSVKSKDDPTKTDRRIAALLEEKGILFRGENYRHSYPHCWRTDAPLINYTMNAWFVAVEKIKKELLSTNEHITWMPAHIKDGRFGKWLEGARDWCISRSRYWGAPVPVWRCELTGETVCITSKKQLEEKIGSSASGLHRQDIDALTWVNESASESAVELCFVRHGETDWNVAGFWQGSTDRPLNDTGRKQAKDARQALLPESYDVVYTSPLSRALETAQILRDTTEKPAVFSEETSAAFFVDERLSEKHMGDWEGKTDAQIDAMDATVKAYEAKRHATPPGGESNAQVEARLHAFVSDIKKRHPGKRVLVVCHSISIKAARGVLTGSPSYAEKLPNLFPFSHTAYPLFRRIPEVLDCWFESGSMPYAQAADREKALSADFIAEAQDQTRGWFYTLHVLGAALTHIGALSREKAPAFKHCICSGLVLAEDGQKMSKSKKNFPDPTNILDTYGADTLRLYLVAGPITRGENLRFSEREMDELRRKTLLPLMQAVHFYTTYAAADGFTPEKNPAAPTHELDRWIRSELAGFLQHSQTALDAYDLSTYARGIPEFIDALTNWYIRRSRRRFWKASVDADKQAAFQTLYEVLTESLKIMAPVVPFISEHLFKTLTGNESVHLTAWPEGVKKWQDVKLTSAQEDIRAVVRMGLAARADAQIKTRQPLAAVTVAGSRRFSNEEADIICEELNVKEIRYTEKADTIARRVLTINAKTLGPRLGAKVQSIIAASRADDFVVTDEGVTVGGELLLEGEYTLGFLGREGVAAVSQGGVVVALDTVVTPLLQLEGRARDINRAVQELRKKADLAVSDRIALAVIGADDVLEVPELKAYLTEEALATSISTGSLPSPAATSSLEGVTIELKKAS